MFIASQTPGAKTSWLR